MNRIGHGVATAPFPAPLRALCAHSAPPLVQYWRGGAFASRCLTNLIAGVTVPVPGERGAGRIASTLFGRRHRPIRRIAKATPSLLEVLVTPSMSNSGNLGK